MIDEETKRRLDKLEQAREEDRRVIQELREDLADLIAAMRESNVYAKECYKRLEKGEAEIKAIGDKMAKNQPAVDSVNKIKAGFLALGFSVLTAIAVGWSVDKPDKNEEISKILSELKEIRKSEHNTGLYNPQ